MKILDYGKTFLISLVGYFFYIYTKLIFWISVGEIINKEILEGCKQRNDDVIFTFWNCSHFFLLSYYKYCYDVYFSPKKIFVLIGKTWKGQLLKCVIQRLGAQTIEISNRDAITRAVGIKNCLRASCENSNIAIVADGPKGPAFKVKPGVFYLSQKTMKNILPIWTTCRWKIRCWRWDKYLLPLAIPYNAVKIVIGEPISFNTYPLSKIEKLRKVETTLNKLALITRPYHMRSKKLPNTFIKVKKWTTVPI